MSDELQFVEAPQRGAMFMARSHISDKLKSVGLEKEN